MGDQPTPSGGESGSVRKKQIQQTTTMTLSSTAGGVGAATGNHQHAGKSGVVIAGGHLQH